MSVVTIIGAGVIGVSWAKLFADAGWEVRVSDPRPDLAEVLSGVNAKAVPDLVEAVSGTDYVQEAGPERIELKHQIFEQAAANTGDHVVLASSSSSLLPSVIAEGNAAADRIVIGHPFNPPNLMPLVEVVPSPSTSAATVDRAIEVYRSLGKLPIREKKEIPGFVGNRLQKVFVDQATYLVQQGVIEPQDLDELVRASLGLRYAAEGPFASEHLGGGPGGIRKLTSGIASQFTFEIGEPDPARLGDVLDSVEKAYGTGEEVYNKLVAQRDGRTNAILKALKDADAAGGAR